MKVKCEHVSRNVWLVLDGRWGCIRATFCVRAEDFTPEEAAEILQSPSSDKIISVPPCEPKAGEAYLFKPDSIRCKSKYNFCMVWFS